MELTLELETGTVNIEMFPEIAPKHCEQIKRLANEGFYDGLTFHRVIDGFMAQGGCPQGTGHGNAGNNIPAEFSAVPHEKDARRLTQRSGDAATATAGTNKGGSQFVITFVETPHIDGIHTVFETSEEDDTESFMGLDNIDQNDDIVSIEVVASKA